MEDERRRRVRVMRLRKRKLSDLECTLIRFALNNPTCTRMSIVLKLKALEYIHGRRVHSLNMHHSSHLILCFQFLCKGEDEWYRCGKRVACSSFYLREYRLRARRHETILVHPAKGANGDDGIGEITEGDGEGGSMGQVHVHSKARARPSRRMAARRRPPSEDFSWRCSSAAKKFGAGARQRLERRKVLEIF